MLLYLQLKLALHDAKMNGKFNSNNKNVIFLIRPIINDIFKNVIIYTVFPQK